MNIKKAIFLSFIMIAFIINIGFTAVNGKSHSLKIMNNLITSSNAFLANSKNTSTLPFRWEPTLTLVNANVYMLFSIFDMIGDEYPQPPYPPSDPHPEDGATDVDLTVTLSWTCGDPNPGDVLTYDLYFGTEENPPLLVEDLTDTFYEVTNLEYGTTYYWRVVASDGMFETSGPVWHFTTKYEPTPTPDVTPPTSQITDPVDGAIIRGKQYTIKGTAEDNPGGSGIKQVEVSIDGGTTWHLASGYNNWTFTWNITRDGVYNLKSRATDLAGNTEEPGEGINVTVDNTPPFIYGAGFWDTYISSSQGGHLTLIAYCPDDDIESVEIYYQSIPTGVYLVDDGTNGDWQAGDKIYTFSVSNIGPGAPTGLYLIEIVATDTAGNKSMTWPYLKIYEQDIYSPPPTTTNIDWFKQYQMEVNRFSQNATERPYIFFGGYWDTFISSESGGNFTLLAYVVDPQGPDDIINVEIYFMGQPTGVYLFDDGTNGDWQANDSVYTISATIPPGIEPNEYLIELVANDAEGNFSTPYPLSLIHI